MRCLYINLDRAADRRAAIEANFRRIAPPGWELVRFPAVDAATAGRLPGRIAPAEKGCFCSHRQALAATLGDDEPVFIVEDDIVFSDRCFRVIEAKLARPGWDLMFTETLPTSFDLMLHLLREWPERASTGNFANIDLAPHLFCTSAGYVVNGTAKASFAERLAALPSLDQPYDLYLRQLVRSDALKAAVIFPFVTSIAATAESSQIQSADSSAADFVLNALRRLLYIDRDDEACRRASEVLRAEYFDENARLGSEIFGAMISPRFPSRR